MRRAAPVALLASLVLAGCLAPAEPVAPSQVQAPNLRSVFEFEHEHTDPALHSASWNLVQVAHLAPAVEGHEHAVHGEIDVAGDVAFVSVGHGFMVYDVADPARPAFLHYEPLPLGAQCAGDLKASLPGLLVVGTQCSGQPNVPGRGLAIYDVADPAAPVLVSTGRPGSSCHMVDTAEVDGERYVYCADATGPNVYQLMDLPGQPATPVLRNPNAPLEPEHVVGNVPTMQQEFGSYGLAWGAGFLVRAHDMTTQPDPLTGAPIVVASQSFAGVRILDGRDPTLGKVLGSWAGEGAEQYSWIHTAQAFARDGKRIVAAITENIVDTPPRLWLLDFTELAAPKVLAEYHLGGADDSHGLVYSAHNFQVVGTRLYIAAYHAGVWALDLTDLASPKPVGLALPHDPSPYDPGNFTFFGIGSDWVTQVWDVVVKDGYVLASDMRSGLYVYRFADDPTGDAAYASFG
ncbi:MAG TPA: hypothetical protein VGR28_07750 [Candidatus Thermoplasmatota archaeon]|jgi:hypothetical protein|nr:hypothetical protein [Candidatus Thermoplasmatota archaeon]